MRDAVVTPNGDSLLQDITLRRPEEFGPGERPTLSLHLMIKNAEACLPRLLAKLGPYIDEVVAVLNDTTDDSLKVLRACLEGWKGTRERLGLLPVRWKVHEVTSGSHPQFYIIDERETYARGKPLAGEDLLWPCTGRPLLSDWAGARNVGWAECTCDYILFLDADDELLDPEVLPGICDVMWRGGIDLVASRYRFAVDGDGHSFSESYRERVARNRAGIAWHGVTHEVLRGAGRAAYVDGNLVVVDHKDNPGVDVRVPGRCLKVLYHHGRSHAWDVDARTFLYLGQEAKYVMPELATAALERYLDLSAWPEERAWACAMVGEGHEAAERHAEASSWYERSLCEHPGAKSAYRLCRSRFREGKWREAVDAYEMGLSNEAVLNVLDHGPVFRDMSKILVAAALDKIADEEESVRGITFGKIRAWLMAQEALRAFPENSELGLLADHIVGTMNREDVLLIISSVVGDDPDNEDARRLLAKLHEVAE